MPRPAISDVHEWINEVLTVPGGIFAKPQTRERASGTQRGKKTLLSLTPARGRRTAMAREPYRGAAAPMQDPGATRCSAHRVAHALARPRAGRPRTGSLAGAARLLQRNAGVPRQAQAGRKPAAEQKSKGLPDPPRQCRGGPRKRGLSILWRAGGARGGDRKVTTGITGLWPPSDQSDAAF